MGRLVGQVIQLASATDCRLPRTAPQKPDQPHWEPVEGPSPTSTPISQQLEESGSKGTAGGMDRRAGWEGRPRWQQGAGM